jgi:ATP-dependent DNA ligase
VGLHPCLQLITQTHDRQLAEQWLTMLPSEEGVVAKRADGRYSAGRQQAWIKVKRQRTVDCVVVGVAGDNASPRLVLGLRHGDRQLHHLGRLGDVICT